jgi:dTDP-4-dehydrorhamnose reductase
VDQYGIQILVLGGTGLAGSALVSHLKAQGTKFRFVARNCDDISLDVTKSSNLEDLIRCLKPATVINCTAEIDFEKCENNIKETWALNVSTVAKLSWMSRLYKFKFVQISTDHYFVGRSKKRHCENHPVTLLNNYSKQKYVAEIATSMAENPLILRTSFTGSSPKNDSRKTFWTWAMQSINSLEPVVLFNDAYTSTLDVSTFARVTFDLIRRGGIGVFNVASSEVYSKADFFWEVARQLDVNFENFTYGSVKELSVARANNLGLCTKKTESLVGYKMPKLSEVVSNLIISEECGYNAGPLSDIL